jgi:hypothetical protein
MTSQLALRSRLAVREEKGCSGGKDEKVGKEKKKAPPLPVVTAVLKIDAPRGLCSSDCLRRRRAECHVQVNAFLVSLLMYCCSADSTVLCGHSAQAGLPGVMESEREEGVHGDRDVHCTQRMLVSIPVHSTCYLI